MAPNVLSSIILRLIYIPMQSTVIIFPGFASVCISVWSFSTLDITLKSMRRRKKTLSQQMLSYPLDTV